MVLEKLSPHILDGLFEKSLISFIGPLKSPSFCQKNVVRVDVQKFSP